MISPFFVFRDFFNVFFKFASLKIFIVFMFVVFDCLGRFVSELLNSYIQVFVDRRELAIPISWNFLDFAILLPGLFLQQSKNVFAVGKIL